MRFQNISERRIRGFLTSTAAALTVLAGITACSSGPAGEERGERVAAHGEAESTARPAEGPLDVVMGEKADEGKGFSLRDATDLNRYVSPAHAEKFKVCFEQEKPHLSAVVLFTVRSSETCPPRVGAEWKADATPDVVGMDLRRATDRLLLTGYTPKHIHVDATGGTVSKERSWSYKICRQSPAAGTPFSADLEPRLVIAASCRKD
ncbi:PASTA domain-containing protein [Streptomyces coeruleofuscus]|uniref:PASTA domain-containing protein n=1 Tax=Streptomyces coeruleofuscus TaxID=66879 RepID=A0ABN3HVQ8_9ACTN